MTKERQPFQFTKREWKEILKIEKEIRDAVNSNVNLPVSEAAAYLVQHGYHPEVVDIALTIAIGEIYTETGRGGILARMDPDIELARDRRPDSDTLGKYFLTKRQQKEEDKPIMVSSANIRMEITPHDQLRTIRIEPNTYKEPTNSLPIERIALDKGRGPIANIIKKHLRRQHQEKR